MVKERKNDWRLRLQIFSCGLLILAAFAPLSETPNKILTVVALVGMLVFLATDSPASRKESALFMILLAASVLLALLLSVNPVWMVLGALVASVLWELDKTGKAEDPAERERPF
jgi:predicted branched-subunit amino acid permease